MKKTLALLLALAMSCTMFAACAEEDDSSKKEKDSSSVAESVADDSSEDESSEDESSEDESSEDESSEDESSKDESSEDESSDPDSGDKPAPSGAEFTGDITIENETAVETSDRLFEALAADIASSQTCTMSADIAQDGIELVIYMTMEGNNIYVDMDFLGIAMTVLSTDEASYIIDTDTKKYYTDSTGSMSDQLGAEDLLSEFTALDDMTYISTSSVTIDGASYTMETYENEYGTEVKYIFDASGDVVAINNDGSEFIPFLLSRKADTSKFSVSGYTQMTDEEFLAWLENSGLY